MQATGEPFVGCQCSVFMRLFPPVFPGHTKLEQDPSDPLPRATCATSGKKACVQVDTTCIGSSIVTWSDCTRPPTVAPCGRVTCIEAV